MAAEALRGKGAVLVRYLDFDIRLINFKVNEKCKRFANELGRRDYLTGQINRHCAKLKEAENLPTSYMLMYVIIHEMFNIPHA